MINTKFLDKEKHVPKSKNKIVDPTNPIIC